MGLSGLVLGALFACLAPPALAANQAVSVRDNFFTPSSVAVKPGESVSWTLSSGDAPHNVAFDDGSFMQPSPAAFAPWARDRTFAAEGKFRYFCQIHGAPGGLGMSGVAYVNAAGNVPPTASFRATPGVIQPGQSVSFDAAASSDPDGTIARYEWDLDGNGSFETDTGTTATVSRVYSTPGTVSVKLRVTDNGGASEEASKSVRVNAQPVASFATSPSAVQAGGAVTFNGSSSRDPDGSIARYEWDLDGNGSFESDTGPTPTVSRTYASPATLSVKLRVTDSDGATAEASRSLQITARPAVAPVLPGLSTTGTRGSTPPPARFSGSKKSIAVGSSGRFTYSFSAAQGLTGTIQLRSVGKVRTPGKRPISLDTKRFTVPGSGIVKLSWKLSHKNLRLLTRSRRIKFRATVILRNPAGLTSTAATTLTLRKPGRR